MTESRKSARSRAMAVIATVVGLVVALLLVEGIVRLAFDEAVQPRYVIDPGYGVRANQVNVRTRHYVPGDYDVAISTNSAGMRGTREYPVERTPGKRRILMLGDSFTFGYGVNDDEVVSAVLEQLLGGRGIDSEVINLAVSGFGQSEELITWENKAKLYRPDVVVLFYYENDVSNNTLAKLHRVDADGKLVRSGSAYLPGSHWQERMFAFAPTRWLFEHSEAWNLIRNRLSSVVQVALLREQGMTSFTEATERYMPLTRALLTTLIEEVRIAGALPVLVIIPDWWSLTSNFPFTPEETAALGVPVVDARQFVNRDDYYRHDTHWRPSGHRKTAERLADVIESMGP